MAITVDATFENGAFKPVLPVSLPEGTPVHLQVSPVDPEFDPLEAVIGIRESGRTDGAANHDQYIHGDSSARSTSSTDDQRDPLEEVIGICDDGPEISLAEQHDKFVYGLTSERKPRK
jgi:predicted DNA-binding antitoxin AbrB/MazE fold protein